MNIFNTKSITRQNYLQNGCDLYNGYNLKKKLDMVHKMNLHILRQEKMQNLHSLLWENGQSTVLSCKVVVH